MNDYICRTGFNLVAAPFTAICCTAFISGKTAIGVAATALSILTLGKLTCINKYADITSASALILKPIDLLTQIVNPYAKQSEVKQSNGMISKLFIERIYFKAREESYSNSFWTKHFVSRGAYALGALGAIITRTADLAIGLIATVISVIPFLGRNEKINQFATNQLGAFALINDICISLRGIVNPQQFLKVNTRL